MGKINYEEKILEALNKLVSLSEGKQVVRTSEDGRFIDCGDGTIKDTKLRLMWQKDGSQNTMNFSDAEKHCKESRVGGFSDWRLPSIDELESLVDRTKYKPAIISTLFNVKTDDWYWTGTQFAGDSGDAWIVNFYYGHVYWSDKDSSNYVRPVRQY